MPSKRNAVAYPTATIRKSMGWTMNSPANNRFKCQSISLSSSYALLRRHLGRAKVIVRYFQVIVRGGSRPMRPRA